MCMCMCIEMSSGDIGSSWICMFTLCGVFKNLNGRPRGMYISGVHSTVLKYYRKNVTLIISTKMFSPPEVPGARPRIFSRLYPPFLVYKDFQYAHVHALLFGMKKSELRPTYWRDATRTECHVTALL